jgi:hypothetical protein
MSPADRRLAVLVAAFAPAHAARLLTRLGSASATEVAAQVERLVEAPRRERLAALAGALVPERTAPLRAEEVARAERPRTAAVCAALGGIGRAALGASPALIRLCRSRLGG